jgi:sugar lactone lactonase YvrE
VTFDWEIALAADAELAERPVWECSDESLLWVDIHAGAVHRLVDGADTEFRAGCSVGAAARRRAGGYVLATAEGFLLTGPDGSRQADPVRPVEQAGGQRFNDGAVDPAGRFWAGTVATDDVPGRLFCLDPDLQVRCVLDDLTESNGIAWSPDGTLMYFVDSGEPRIRTYSFDVESGAIGTLDDLVVLDPEVDGTPDGLITDSAGAVWVALWGGGVVRRYAPDGTLLAEHRLPVTQVTCPALGGADLCRLFVTTAWEGMDDAERARQPSAGSIFVRTVPTPGLPSPRFAA